MLDDVMRKNRGLVVKFKNIDIEDFTHSFDGMPWMIKAGEAQFFPKAHARLFAKHLAQKIIRRTKKASGEGKMDGAILFKEDDMTSLMGKILGDTIELLSEEKSPQDAYKEKVAEINRTYNMPAPSVEMTKAELIAKIQEKGQRVDVTKNKGELLEILKSL